MPNWSKAVTPRGERPLTLVLHNVDGLRQQARARGLDEVPREQYGAIEVRRSQLRRPFVRRTLGGRRFTSVTLEATSSTLEIKELGWTLRRVR